VQASAVASVAGARTRLMHVESLLE
jgi:hypothetical protein